MVLVSFWRYPDPHQHFLIRIRNTALYTPALCLPVGAKDVLGESDKVLKALQIPVIYETSHHGAYSLNYYKIQ